MMTRTRCTISENRNFIVLLIAKNASSTIRIEFSKPEYESHEELIRKLNPEELEIPIYAFLREPISRFLSGYHEVYIRHQGQMEYYKRNGIIDTPKHHFLNLNDHLMTINEFLDHIEERGFFDPHILPQSEYIQGLPITKYYSILHLEYAVNEIRSIIGLDFISDKIGRHRTKRIKPNKRNYIYEIHEIPSEIIDRIKLIYKKDFELYQERIIENRQP